MAVTNARNEEAQTLAQLLKQVDFVMEIEHPHEDMHNFTGHLTNRGDFVPLGVENVVSASASRK